MKRRYIFILAFALGLLLFFGRYGIPKSDKPLGVFMTYGDEGQYYGFVNPKNNNVFLADISKIEDKKGNPLDLKDLNSGDILEFHGECVETKSDPPIYTKITKVVRIKKELTWVEKQYRKLINEKLDIEKEDSEIPFIAVETVNKQGYVTTGISAASFSWDYKDENGKKQHTESSESTDLNITVVELDKEEVETNIYVSSAPESFKFISYINNNSSEVELSKTPEGYKTTLKPETEYEIQGVWKNGNVKYRFVTKKTEE